MCPLRFVLIFISALVAAFLAWSSFSSAPSIHEDDAVAHSEDALAREEADVKRSARSCFQSAVDFGTGRYLYQLWKGRGEGKTKERTA